MAKSHARLNRKRWASLRRFVFERDGYRCAMCGKHGRLECDHVKRLEDGGDPYDPANLQAVCRSCHIGKTRIENMPDDESRAWFQRLMEIANA